jgi:hypothetical protein
MVLTQAYIPVPGARALHGIFDAVTGTFCFV